MIVKVTLNNAVREYDGITAFRIRGGDLHLSDSHGDRCVFVAGHWLSVERRVEVGDRVHEPAEG